MGDMKDSFQIKLMTTLLEQVLQALPKQIHHHHMVHLTVVSFLITYEVEKGHESFST